jgi:alpha-mannosidase
VTAAVVNNLMGYIGTPNPEELYVAWQRHAQKVEHPEVLFPYGFGDGGGGVTEEMLEMRRHAEERQYPGLPSVRTGMPEGYFDDIVARGSRLPVWDGELYVETHRGTYTTQSSLKKANRHSELLLRDAEIWGSLAERAGQTYARDTMHAAWKRVLLQQFHDILPGTSVPEVMVDAHSDYDAVQVAVAPLVESALSALTPVSVQSRAVRIFNSLSWARYDILHVTVPHSENAIALVDVAGTEHAAQKIAERPNGDIVVIDGAKIPSFGHADFKIVAKPAGASQIFVSTQAIETPRFFLTLDANGGITSLYDKTAHREVIAEGGIGNDLQLLQDGPEVEDAWNVHETIDKRRYPIEGSTTITVVETGPVRAIVRVRRLHRQSVIEQDIVVSAISNRIDFVTRVDWQETHTMLKVAFPLAIRSLNATYEVQFSAIERATHQNTTWESQKFEVPAQRWSDLSEPGYGVSLMNDSRYGYDTKENVLRLSLLRSTTWPDPQADRALHEFTYSLLPHAGSWIDAETVRRAWELNVPVRSRPLDSVDSPQGFLCMEGLPAVIEALKPAEDGRGLILRVYEPHGARGEVVIRLGIAVSEIFECSHIEEDGAQVEVDSRSFRFQIKPFQIRTFRLMA